MKHSDLPRPTVARRLWLKGVQYQGETTEQMEAREKRFEEEDRLRDLEVERLWKWKCKPIWELK